MQNHFKKKKSQRIQKRIISYCSRDLIQNPNPNRYFLSLSTKSLSNQTEKKMGIAGQFGIPYSFLPQNKQKMSE